jgi:hypothetical protein
MADLLMSIAAQFRERCLSLVFSKFLPQPIDLVGSLVHVLEHKWFYVSSVVPLAQPLNNVTHISSNTTTLAYEVRFVNSSSECWHSNAPHHLPQYTQ